MTKNGWIAALALTAAAGAHADVVLGSYDFNSAQFGDTLAQSDGGTWAAGNWLNVANGDPGSPSYLTGANFNTGIANIGLGGNAAVYTIGYSTAISNGTGSDLGIVTARFSVSDSVTIEVSTDGGITFSAAKTYAPGAGVDSGSDCLYYYGAGGGGQFSCDLFVTEVDLSDLGVSDGAAVNAIRVTGAPELDLVRVAGFADANGVPLPGTLALTGLGLLLAGALRRR